MRGMWLGELAPAATAVAAAAATSPPSHGSPQFVLRIPMHSQAYIGVLILLPLLGRSGTIAPALLPPKGSMVASRAQHSPALCTPTAAAKAGAGGTPTAF